MIESDEGGLWGGDDDDELFWSMLYRYVRMTIYNRVSWMEHFTMVEGRTRATNSHEV